MSTTPVASPSAAAPGEALPIAAAGPVTQAERIASIDVLRGFALLGILVMNVQSFAMIGAAYSNPTMYGDFEGVNYAVWLLSHVFTDLKMMAIFSMLFGAGIVLMAERAEATARSARGVHYRRMGALLIIGLAHAYLLWYGDILVFYSMVGMLVYPARLLRPRTLLIIAAALLGIGSTINILIYSAVPNMGEQDLKGMLEWVAPTAEQVREEIAAHRGGYLDARLYQAPTILTFQTLGFLTWGLWRIGGLMLIGMALYKVGTLSAQCTVRFYKGLITAGAAIGLPLVLIGVWRHEALDWDPIHSMFLASQFNYWGSLLVAMLWIGVVMLICKSGAAPRLRARLAAVGQMALTNYLMQTIICTTIFYGYGLGAYGHVQRIGQIAIVFAIWIVQLRYSPLWLRRYRFGPFEWMWRAMTYGHAPQLRR